MTIYEVSLYGGTPKIFLHLNALRIDVGDFLIKPPFAVADVADAGQLFFKIIFTENIGGVFQTLIVHGEPFDDVFFKAFRCPNAEIGCLCAVDRVA